MVASKMTLADKEAFKAGMTLPQMLEYLNEHPDRHTPFMDRWFTLCCEHKTMVYPAKPEGAAPGRRLEYGTPKRVVECIESAAPLGHLGVWFVKLCPDQTPIARDA